MRGQGGQRWREEARRLGWAAHGDTAGRANARSVLLAPPRPLVSPAALGRCLLLLALDRGGPGALEGGRHHAGEEERGACAAFGRAARPCCCCCPSRAPAPLESPHLLHCTRAPPSPSSSPAGPGGERRHAVRREPSSALLMLGHGWGGGLRGGCEALCCVPAASPTAQRRHCHASPADVRRRHAALPGAQRLALGADRDRQARSRELTCLPACMQSCVPAAGSRQQAHSSHSSHSHITRSSSSAAGAMAGTPPSTAPATWPPRGACPTRCSPCWTCCARFRGRCEAAAPADCQAQLSALLDSRCCPSALHSTHSPTTLPLTTHTRQIPDLDAVLHTADFACVKREWAGTPLPLFGYQTSAGHRDLAWPDFTYWGHEHQFLQVGVWWGG